MFYIVDMNPLSWRNPLSRESDWLTVLIDRCLGFNLANRYFVTNSYVFLQLKLLPVDF